jgi:hypothetical protein
MGSLNRKGWEKANIINFGYFSTDKIDIEMLGWLLVGWREKVGCLKKLSSRFKSLCMT